MDFLNDKKNQPIIIAVTVAIVLGVAFFYYQTMFKPKSASTEYTEQSYAPDDFGAPASSDPMPAPSDPMPAPPDPMAAQDPSAVATIETTSLVADASAATGSGAGPLEKGTDDPFKPPPAPPRAAAPPPPPEPIPYPTFRIVPKQVVASPVLNNPSVEEMDQTPRRMAGLLYNGSISAILETGGSSVVVRPGDYVENRTMRVEKIEPGRIVLKSVSVPARFVEVKMASATNLTGSPGGGGVPSSPTPSGPRPGGRGFVSPGGGGNTAPVALP